MSRNRLAGGLLVAVGLVLLVTPRLAQACGGFFSETQSSEVVAMSDIRVLLVEQTDVAGKTTGVEQYVQIGYQGSARSFAWVYPVAGNPEVSEAATSPFPALEEGTRPKINIHTQQGGGGGGGFGCGAAAADMPSSRTTLPPPVKVWQSGQVGAFDYVVITAARVEEMLEWLQANGFTVPASTQPVLAHYVGLGWFFVAMKVSVEKVAAEVPATTVVRLRYPAAELRYPLRMVSLSPSTRTSLEIYLITAGPVAPQAPFRRLQVGSEELQATSASTHNYDEVFGALIASDPFPMVLEYASRSWSPAGAKLLDRVQPGSLLTRYRSVLAAAQMTTDLVFTADPLAIEEYVPVYDLINGGLGAAVPGPLLLLAAAWLVVAGRRRRRRAP